MFYFCAPMSAPIIDPNLQVEISNRQILKIALPIRFAMLIPQANFITNNIFLGQLGEQELGAAGVTGVYYLIFAAIGFGLNNGLQALISRRAGENRTEEIGKLFSQGVRIAMVIAAIGILITYMVAPYLLRWALASEEMAERANYEKELNDKKPFLSKIHYYETLDF